MIVYKVTDVKTGETVTGIAKEVAQIIGVKERLIRLYANNGYRASKRWTVEKVTADDKKMHNVPESFWEEWIRVTKALRRCKSGC